MLRWFVACLPLLALLASAPVAAETSSDRATARVLAMDGHKALKNKDFAKAEDLLSRAYALVPAPTVGVELARAQTALGKVVSAHETYSRVIHEPLPPSVPATQLRSVDDARREIEALEPRLPSVVVTVVGSNVAALDLDGAPVSRVTLGVSRFLDPGTHVVKATADGFAPATAEFSLQEGESKRVELTLVPLPATSDAPPVTPLAPPTTSGLAVEPASAGGGPTVGVSSSASPGSSRGLIGDAAVGFGVGAVALGAVAWLEAHGLGHGAASTQQQRDAYARTDALGLAGLGAGVALTAAGLALRATADGGHRSPAKEVGWAHVGAGVSGVGFGDVTGLMARHVQSQLDDVCRPACPAVQQPNVSNQDTLGAWSVLGFVAGGVAAAGGVVSLLAFGDEPPAHETASRAALVPYVSASTFGLGGSF